jgi:hypothetical protein
MTGEKLTALMEEVFEELKRAHRKHGSPPLPNGTRNGGMNLVCRAQAQNSCDRAAREGRVTWWHIIEEEVAEASCEEGDKEFRAELLQVAAMCFKAIADIDTRPGADNPKEIRR